MRWPRWEARSPRPAGNISCTRLSPGSPPDLQARRSNWRSSPVARCTRSPCAGRSTRTFTRLWAPFPSRVQRPSRRWRPASSTWMSPGRRKPTGMRPCRASPRPRGSSSTTVDIRIFSRFPTSFIRQFPAWGCGWRNPACPISRAWHGRTEVGTCPGRNPGWRRRPSTSPMDGRSAPPKPRWSSWRATSWRRSWAAPRRAATATSPGSPCSTCTARASPERRP